MQLTAVLVPQWYQERDEEIVTLSSHFKTTKNSTLPTEIANFVDFPTRIMAGGVMQFQIPPLSNRTTAFRHPWGFFAIVYCYFIFVSKESSTDILVELNLGRCEVLEISIFSCSHSIHLIVITKSVKSAQILYHVIPLEPFCHP